MALGLLWFVLAPHLGLVCVGVVVLAVAVAAVVFLGGSM